MFAECVVNYRYTKSSRLWGVTDAAMEAVGAAMNSKTTQSHRVIGGVAKLKRAVFGR